MSNKHKEAILAKIQAARGCLACKHMSNDGSEFLDHHRRHWCAKREESADSELAVDRARDCLDWALVTDKEHRNALVKCATDGQDPLPFDDEAGQ